MASGTVGRGGGIGSGGGGAPYFGLQLTAAARATPPNTSAARDTRPELDGGPKRTSVAPQKGHTLSVNLRCRSHAIQILSAIRVAYTVPGLGTRRAKRTDSTFRVPEVESAHAALLAKSLTPFHDRTLCPRMWERLESERRPLPDVHGSLVDRTQAAVRRAARFGRKAEPKHLRQGLHDQRRLCARELRRSPVRHMQVPELRDRSRRSAKVFRRGAGLPSDVHRAGKTVPRRLRSPRRPMRGEAMHGRRDGLAPRARRRQCPHGRRWRRLKVRSGDRERRRRRSNGRAQWIPLVDPSISIRPPDEAVRS